MFVRRCAERVPRLRQDWWSWSISTRRWVELAGLPIPGHLEGSSFAPLLDEPGLAWKRGAYSQYTRGQRRGYSVRSETARYTEWVDLQRGEVLERELYDHVRDPDESVNLAGLEASRRIVDELARELDGGEGWRREHRRLAQGARDLVLGRPFTSHMVLQRNKPVRVWGEARAGTEVRVHFGDQVRRTLAARDGTWRVELPPMAAVTNPRTLKVIAGTESITLEDILVGDVWVCAGQSNMRFPLRQSTGGKESIDGSADASLRLLDMAGQIYPSPTKYPLGKLRSITAENYYTSSGWQRAFPASTATFSAVAYHFGAALRRELDVPIGLVHNAVGGVPMEAYIPRKALLSDEELRPLVERWYENDNYPRWCRERGRLNLAAWLDDPQQPVPSHPFAPGFLYEAGMRPFERFSLRGFIWYQGESNATIDGSSGPPVASSVNRHKLVTLIQSWREARKAPTLPFYLVQLPGMGRPWMHFREMQLEVARSLTDVGMAVSIDVGHETNVHPPEKRPVGERLARAALAGTYAKDIVAGGPLYVSHELAGAEVRLSFEQIGDGLRTRDGRPPRGFTVAAADRVFHPATAAIRNASVVVTNPAVLEPRAVRYGWAPFPDVNLVNAAGLPAPPFRTDDWEEPTHAEGLNAGATTSFEEATPGEFGRLKCDGLVWTSAPGHAEIDAEHAKSGRQCLRLLGGTDRSAVVTLPGSDRPERLSFWAERWTRRPPFRFRVAAFRDDAWKEIYNGDEELVIGRFRTQVSIPLPPTTSRLRFTSTSPAGSGVLLDDLRIQWSAKRDAGTPDSSR